MNLSPVISIVVPVYKVEKYIHECINSLVNQTIKDIEIILVDDGSPDTCPEICDSYALQDSRIKVIHKKNGGLSSARNAGIRTARGKYIGFVDSDDFVSETMYNKMLQVAEANKVDFVMCDYVRVNGKARTNKTLDLREGFYDKDNIVHEIFPNLIMRESIDYGPLLSVWNCLYKTSFLKEKDLYFDAEIKYSEDNIFSALVGYHADSLYYLKEAYFYQYRYNPVSITTTYKKDAWDVYCKMNQKIKAYLGNSESFDFSRQVKLHIIYFAFSAINQLRFSDKSITEQYREYRKIIYSRELREGFTDFILPKLPLKFKINLLLVKYRFIWPLVLNHSKPCKKE